MIRKVQYIFQNSKGYKVSIIEDNNSEGLSRAQTRVDRLINGGVVVRVNKGVKF